MKEGQYQIGVIGSFKADKEVEAKLDAVAREIGAAIANGGHILVFGPELDGNSVSIQAALAAKEAGGSTMGILYGSSWSQLKFNEFKEENTKEEIDNKIKNIKSEANINIQRVKKAADNVVWAGAERGGPRESILVLSCDGLIAIAGGSGTLTEMMIAYMNRRPVVALEGTGGWADKMANQFPDDRKRTKIIGAKTPEEAVRLIIQEIEQKNK